MRLIPRRARAHLSYPDHGTRLVGSALTDVQPVSAPADLVGEDDMSGRESLGADDGERENFHRSARAPPATRRHAGHITAITTPQARASLQDFCPVPGLGLVCCYEFGDA